MQALTTYIYKEKSFQQTMKVLSVDHIELINSRLTYEQRQQLISAFTNSL